LGIIRKKNKNSNYVCIDKTVLEMPDLSAKAKGLHCYLIGKPDDWEIYISELPNHFKDGRDSIVAGIKELESIGVIIKEQTKNKNGKFDGWDYTVLETPLSDNPQPQPDFPHSITGKTVNGKPKLGNPPLLSNNKLSNNSTNLTDQKIDQLEMDLPKKTTEQKPETNKTEKKIDYKKFEEKYLELFKTKCTSPCQYNYGINRKLVKPILNDYEMDIVFKTLEIWFNSVWGEKVGYDIRNYRQSINTLLIEIDKGKTSGTGFGYLE
jgi:hypothetical protein